MMLRRLLHIFAALTALALPVGCASDNDLPDDNPSDGIATVRFSIRALPSNLATRADADADGAPVSPVYDQEKINDWWMVFVDNKGVVRKKIYRSGANQDQDQDNYSGFEPAKVVGTGAIEEETGAIEEETFECEIPGGTYTVYAFANITPTQVNNASGIDFVNSSLSNVSEFNWDDTDDTDVAKAALSLNCWNKNTNIPMSGKQSITVTNRIEESFSIEVVRMVAKIQFRFTNPTTDDVTINSVSINPITTSKVSLFPDYTAIGVHAYTPLAGSTYKELTYDFNISVPKRENEKDGINDLYFYCKESISNMANEGRFTIGINMTRKGVTEYDQYNVTSDIKKYINRNDWIVIPITLTDYAVKVDASFYPPIGGYPAIQSNEDIDGAYYFTFGTQGEFSINPYVIDLSKGPNAYLAPERYTIEIDNEKGGIQHIDSEVPKNGWEVADWSNYTNKWIKTTTESKGIFNTIPIFPDRPNNINEFEILGELNESEGIARIPIEISVYDEKVTTNSKPRYIYNRIIYIIRQNKESDTDMNTDD